MLRSFRTAFLLLAILNPINPERAPRERLGGLDGPRQRAAGSRLLCTGGWDGGKGGSLGEGVLGGGQRIPSWMVPSENICIAALLLPRVRA